jgi:Domain of unknown function (DUF4349)
MGRKHRTLLLVGCILSATGCRRFVHSSEMALDRAQPAMGLYATAMAAPPQRFIAESHKIDVIATESGLEKSLESLLAFCGTIQCEIVSSSVTARAEDSPPSGSISLRVAPEDAGKLFAQVQKLGKIAQHTTAREDKTTAVIDSDAKIKNLTTFRDNLRSMLAKPSATVNDFVEIQQQLMETQSQLDSETAQRNVLANETEKIEADFSFRVPGNTGNVSSWRKIGSAFRQSGSILADSIASLITVVVAVIPWLVLIVPAGWLARKIWRRSRKNRAITPPPAAAIL